MKANYVRSYRSTKSGNVVFVYSVEGTKKELEAYKEAQGENLVIDDTTGKPLYFTTKGFGKEGKLIITSKGNIVPDLSDFHMLNSMAEQFGGVLGQEIVRAGLNKTGNNNTPSATPKAEEAEQDENIGDL